MLRKVFTSEPVINKLREAEVLVSQRKTVEEICRALGISDQTYYRWPPKAKSTADCAPTRRSGWASSNRNMPG